MPDDSIRTAGAADLDAVVDVLTAAFQDDPLMSWAFPDDAIRRRRLRGLWTFMAGDGYVPRGACRPSSPAATAPRCGRRRATGSTASSGRPTGRAFVTLLEGDVERLGSLSEQMDAHHPHDRDHWYLMAIGVSPAAQGRRLGSALLAHTLAAADAAGAPAYLEATEPAQPGAVRAERVRGAGRDACARRGGPPRCGRSLAPSRAPWAMAPSVIGEPEELHRRQRLALGDPPEGGAGDGGGQPEQRGADAGSRRIPANHTTNARPVATTLR